MTTCRYRHTDYQPDLDEWACPNCGEKADFLIEAGPWYDSDCDMLHEDDKIVCYGNLCDGSRCKKEYTGKELAEILHKKAMVAFVMRESESGPTTREIAESLAKKLSTTTS